MTGASMRFLKFNSEINLGNLLTLGALIIGAFALRYQASQADIARQNLDIKVKDVRELADSISREAKTRAENEQRRDAAFLDTLFRINAFEENANAALFNAGVARSTSTARICASIRYITGVIGGLEVEDKERRNHLLSAIDEVHGAMLAGETVYVKDAGRRKSAQERFDKAMGELVAQKLPPDQFRVRMEALLLRHKEDIEESVMMMTKEIAGPSERLERADKRLAECATDMATSDKRGPAAVNR
jgi:hypothetical protein